MGSNFCVMLDMSRNGVMKVEKVKEFVDYISKMGYKSLQLYTEDTFEVDNEPYFGYMRGGYTKADLKEIDAYCMEKGIELIPCIQVLAHLNGLFKWDEYNVHCHDTGDILLIGAERTYTLIENIFKTIAECFTSKKVHIGMDEANNVGLGNFLIKHGFQNRFSILRQHLDKVVEIASKYNYKLMMWSDMFFRLLNNGLYDSTSEITQEVIDSVPKEIDLIYWAYDKTDKKTYAKMVDRHRQFKNNMMYAGSIHLCNDFAPDNSFTYQTMLPALSVMKEKQVNDIILTVWGDDGHECSYFAALPALYRLKRFYDGENRISIIEKEFYDIVGVRYKDMLDLQLPNTLLTTAKFNKRSKYLFYADIFNFYYDIEFVGDEKENLLKAAKKLRKRAKDNQFGYIFKSTSAFAKALSLKFDMGYRLRKAYKKNDKKMMYQLVGEITKLTRYIKDFYKLFKKLWYIENTPSGFDVQDIRLYGLIGRLLSCRERLIAYLDGTIDKIDELEVDILPCFPSSYNIWGKIVTPNVLTHNYCQC